MQVKFLCMHFLGSKQLPNKYFIIANYILSSLYFTHKTLK